MMEIRPTVLLDRDGTINTEVNYLSHPARVVLLPGAAEGLRRLRQLGFRLVVVTNQSGIGRGYFDESQLGEIHDRLRRLLAAEGVALDGIYHCPHVPEDQCSCRKPGTEMVLRAAADLGFDPAECIMVGDKECDIELGRAVGAMTVLVRTGYGAQGEASPSADCVVDDLAALATLVEQGLGAARAERSLR